MNRNRTMNVVTMYRRAVPKSEAPKLKLNVVSIEVMCVTQIAVHQRWMERRSEREAIITHVDHMIVRLTFNPECALATRVINKNVFVQTFSPIQ